jgi:hypothetical protein
VLALIPSRDPDRFGEPMDPSARNEEELSGKPITRQRLLPQEIALPHHLRIIALQGKRVPSGHRFFLPGEHITKLRKQAPKTALKQDFVMLG